MVAKLEAHLKRARGVVIRTRAQRSRARTFYNKLLYAEGNGLLPGPLVEVVASPPDDPGYRSSRRKPSFARRRCWRSATTTPRRAAAALPQLCEDRTAGRRPIRRIASVFDAANGIARSRPA